MTDGHVYAVASGKGGVGKTTTAVNLGAAFVEAGREVVVVDVDLGMANLENFLDIDAGDVTLHDVLAGEASVGDAITAAPGGFDVVLGSPDIEAFGRADPAKLGEVVDALSERYDIVLLDGGGGLSHDVTVPLGLADGIIVVTTPTDAAITNAKKTKSLVERLGGTIEGMIVTRIGGAGRATPEVVADRIDLSVLGSVPEDGAILVSIDKGAPLVSIDRQSPAAQSYREIAYSLLEEPLPRDWAEDEADPMAQSFTPGTDSDEDSTAEAGEGADTPAETASPESADTADEASTEATTADPDEPAATDPAEGSTPGHPDPSGEAMDADSAAKPQSGIAERLESMEDADEDETAEGAAMADADEGPDADEMTEEGEETAQADVDVIPGPSEQPAADTEDSADEGSLFSRLFGGLFG